MSVCMSAATSMGKAAPYTSKGLHHGQPIENHNEKEIDVGKAMESVVVIKREAERKHIAMRTAQRDSWEET